MRADHLYSFPSSHLLFPLLTARMPRPEVNLDRLRPEIEERIAVRKQSQKEVLL
jgi:hypothetical protein